MSLWARGRGAVRGALSILVVALIGVVGVDIASGGRAAGDRRFLIFATARHLRIGMTRAEVSAILDTHAAPYITRVTGVDHFVVRAEVGPAQFCILGVQFSSDGRLTAAGIRGEDGEHDRFADAPSDLP